MNTNRQYGSKWHEGWWYLTRIVDGVETVIPGPHFDNQADAVLTARWLTVSIAHRQQEARHLGATGSRAAITDSKLQPGE